MRAKLTGAIACLLLMSSSVPAGPEPDVEVFSQAEASFRQGVESKTRFRRAQKHFANAANEYLELHRRGVRSAALYLNLGNAAALADRWPEAIWAYHMGLKLDPNDAELRAHLAFARGKVLLPPAGQGRPDPDTWPTWLHRPTVQELFWVVLLAYVSSWVAGACAFSTRRAKYHWLTAVLILVASISGAGLWYELHEANVDRQTPLVILAANTDFSLGNAASYEPAHPKLPLLPRGIEARQLHRRGNWLQVRLSTGEIGWLPHRQVLVVEP